MLMPQHLARNRYVVIGPISGSVLCLCDNVLVLSEQDLIEVDCILTVEDILKDVQMLYLEQ